jgi:glycosyltransferase involved in cell wall biosynthesis
MVQRPTVSLILASYNYETYVGAMLASVIAQTIRDIEIIVIDDASTDRSRQVIDSFSDPRIKLHVNERNMGPAWTYNRGSSFATGEFVGYLDVDDWLDLRKTELQLEHFRRNPSVDVLGGYVTICDRNGDRHPAADEWEASINQPHDLNDPAKWVGRNHLSAPTVMFRRSLHDRVGLRDPGMVHASDYEFWTRALRAGCRFDLVQVPLVHYRLHDRNTSARNPDESFFELTYSLAKNLLPTIKPPQLDLLGKAVHWIVTHEQFGLLSETQRHRLLGLLLTTGPSLTFRNFRDALANDRDNAALNDIGRRLYAAIR